MEACRKTPPLGRRRTKNEQNMKIESRRMVRFFGATTERRPEGYK